MQANTARERVRRSLCILFAALLLGSVEPAWAAGWAQFHGDGPNRGARPVDTGLGIFQAWSFDVGDVVYSSPVVGPRGGVYVGNLDGDIIAVDPDGSERWRTTTELRFLSSPAVAADGRVYALGTAEFPDAEPPDHTFRSVLVTLGPDGMVLDLNPLPEQGYTAGAPKIWSSGERTYVFVHAYTRTTGATTKASALFIFDGDGQLRHQEDLGCVLPFTSTSPITDALDSVWGVIKKLWQVYTNVPAEFDTGGVEGINLVEEFGWNDPTVALAERADLGGDGSAIVTVVDQDCSDLHAFRWAPPDLDELWLNDLKNDKLLLRSSPAVLNDATMIVLGRADGKVIAYDVATGNQLWSYDAGEEVMGTPASRGGLIYVTSRRRIQALHPVSADVVWKRGLRGQSVASPALSANQVHVSTNEELLSFSLDLESVAHDGDGRGGLASPALGPDGSLYVIATIDENTFLQAYPAP